jgi:hypothetical protein
LTTLLLATCLTVLAIGAVATAHTQTGAQPSATISSAALHRAVASRATDHRALAHSAIRLSACLRAHPGRCDAERRAVRRARARLIAAKRLVRKLTGRIARRYQTPGAGTQTSKLSGSGQTPHGNGAGVAGDGFASKGSLTDAGSASSGSSPSGSGSAGNSTSGNGGLGEGTGSTGPFEMGVVAGSAVLWELPFIQQLGAHTARTEFEIGTSTSQMGATMEAYARAGVRPLLLASFYGTLPTAAQAQSLGTWAAQFGPGGSFWKGKNLPASSAVTSIEFGNETSYEYQYSDNSSSGYATRAQTYALRFEEAQAAIHAANPNVALLAQGDPGNAPGTSWMDNMFKAVPNFGSIVGGWTVHPYGPNWQSIVDKLVSSAKADGASSSIPIDVTEWGLSTDNGRCLDDNYGFNKCMTYAEAATTLTSNLSAMRARYGSRLASMYLFQARDQKETGTSSGREGYFGALQSNEAPKGAYTTTVQSLLSSNP